MKGTPRILITPGEPAGIGPDITLQLAQKSWPAELIVIADPNVLMKRAKKLKLDLKLAPFEKDAAPAKHIKGTLKIIPVPVAEAVIPGKLNLLNAPYVRRTLEIAAELCLNQTAQALVTGPVHKEILLNAGIAFRGHTEFLAEQCGVPQTVMMFCLKEMKVALATTHIALKEVSGAVTKAHLSTVLSVLENDLREKFKIKRPKIGVCGLNPHAGEGGHLGREEIDVIVPVIEELKTSMAISGPYSADTIFLSEHFDVILAMYHDQALPLVKYLGFDSAVNVTLGLPFIRTSVDHGTALELAGSSKANAGSMSAALKLAMDMI